MKIYRMNDCDWVAAESLTAAIVFYLRSECGMEISDAPDAEGLKSFEGAELSDARELTGEEMANHEYHTGDYDEGNQEIISFDEALARMITAEEKFPCLFASTEFC